MPDSVHGLARCDRGLRATIYVMSERVGGHSSEEADKILRDGGGFEPSTKCIFKHSTKERNPD